MALYKITNDNLEKVKEAPFKLEKEIQKIFEQNLKSIMDLEFVKSEFTIKNRRIDTLAFDPQSKGFVIIEYKRDKNSSVIDQGFTYLSLVLQNKADCILEYNESMCNSLTRNDVDWTQTRVVFVASDFTENQIEATNFKDLAIELWAIKRYSDNSIIITPIRKSKAAESIKPIAQKSREFESVVDEIKVYTEDDLIVNKPDATIELYEKLKRAIINIADGIEIKPQKHYISFKKDGKHIAHIEVQKASIKLGVNVRKGRFEDTKKLSRDISTIGHFGAGDYEIKITDDKNIEYIMSLVKQAIS